MKTKHVIIITSTLLLILSITSVSAQAPYSITVEPLESSAEPGDILEYTVTINAEPGFEESIYIELEVSALTYNEIYFSDVVDPPYPIDYDFVFEVPEDAPRSITVTGIIRGISGDYDVEEEVSVRITGGGILDTIIGWLLSILTALRNLFT
jgi:hypothetical protein